MRRDHASISRERCSGPRRALALIGIVVLLLAGYAGMLLLQDSGDVGALASSLPYALVESVAVALCVTAMIRTRLAEPQIVAGAAAVITYSAGDAYYLASLDGGGALTEVSVADFFYLAFYPLMLSALVIMVVRRLRELAFTVLLGSVVGALGAASIMALVLTPVLRNAGAAHTDFEVLAIVYPLLDLLLISAVGGVLAARGLDAGPRWPFLIVGLVIFCVADVVFALDLDDYAVGSLVDIGWVAGLAGIALWVGGAGHPDQESSRRRRIPGFAAPVVAAACALVVLVAGTRLPIPFLAVILAASTLALAVVPLSSRQRTLFALAHTDELTRLPNRRTLLTDVPERLAGGGAGALFLLDLDRFKHVNDALGHDVGDALLVQVAGRLKRRIRARDLLVRLGGDEFAVFLADATEQEAVAVAQQLKAELTEPVHLETASIQVSASIGIALTPQHGADITLLMRRADIAMFRAKAARSGHHVYTSADDDGALRLRTLQEVRTAFAEGEFELHYQPKIGLPDQRFVGVEALVRWNHPTRGQLPPGEFLPLVEEAGLMPDLSTLVLGRALRQLAHWRSEGLAATVAVNMSSSCIVPGLPQDVLLLLQRNAVPASCLLVEITEDVLMSDPVGTARILGDLRKEGVQISIDDFGTGYSSLSYLRDLPVDELKLDRSFITAMLHDARALGLVRSIIDLAHALDLRVVAEGVEDVVTLEELREQGCDHAQGFLLGAPLPASGMKPWLAARSTAPEGSRPRASMFPG